jgi:hypothetical protein
MADGVRGSSPGGRAIVRLEETFFFTTPQNSVGQFFPIELETIQRDAGAQLAKRCRNHGGPSTGPKTPAGKDRSGSRASSA